MNMQVSYQMATAMIRTSAESGHRGQRETKGVISLSRSVMWESGCHRGCADSGYYRREFAGKNV
jgi:hypothetical protein